MDSKKKPKTDSQVEKEAEEKKKAANDSKLLSSDPSALSEEALDAALAAAKTKLEEAGYGDQAQSVVDRLKQEVQTRQEAEGKAAEAEHVAKSELADTMVKQGKSEVVKKAAENRAKAHKEQAEASPEAKRANVAKTEAGPDTAAGRTLANLPPVEKAKLKAKAKLREKAEKAKADSEEKKEPDPDKKEVTLSNGVTFTLDLANAPKGQLAFRYKHGWILINPMVPSRGKMGGGLARKFGVKSGTTTKGYFETSGKNQKQFVPTSTGHPTIQQQIKDTQNKLNFQIAQQKEDEALKAEVKQVKLDTAKEEFIKAKDDANKATTDALSEDNKLKSAKLHEKAFEAHTNAQTKAADLAELDSGAQKAAAHHSDLALKHQKLAGKKYAEYAIDEQNKKAQAEADYKTAAMKASDASIQMMQAKPGSEQKVDAHVDAAIANGLAAKAAKKAGMPEMAEQHELAAEYQKKLAAKLSAKLKSAAAPKAEKPKPTTPKFTKVEGGVLVNGKKETVSGWAAPKGKLFVHKSTSGKGYTVTSVSTGEKMPGDFTTLKEAKAAAVWLGDNFPGKAFTQSGFQDVQKKKPEEWAKFKEDWVTNKPWQQSEPFQPTKTEPDSPKKKAILEAIDSLPESEYNKATPTLWKTYFESTYDIENKKPGEAIDFDSESVKAGISAFETLKKNGVSDETLAAANKHVSGKKPEPVPEWEKELLEAEWKAEAAEKKTYTKEDFKVTLPGPGMYADGGAIKKLFMQVQDEPEGPKHDAMMAAYMEAKGAFKEKHGVAFSPGKVENSATGSTFMPSITTWDASVEAGFKMLDSQQSAHGDWTPGSEFKTHKGAYIYSGSSYKSINAQLRKYGPTGGSSDSYIAQMDKEFAAVPPVPEAFVVGRKISGNGPFPGFPPAMEPGSEYIEKGYSSTSKNAHTWDGNTELEVRVPAGTKVLDLNHSTGSSNSGEQEVLLNRGTKFRVVKDEKEGTLRKITVEVVSE